MGGSERRRYIRPESLNLLDYIVIDEQGRPGEYSMGRTLNISIGGLLMETHIPLPAGHRVQITLGLQDVLVDVTGRIIHSTRSDDNMYRNGIKFSQVPDADRHIIYKYVEAFHKRYPDAKNQPLL